MRLGKRSSSKVTKRRGARYQRNLSVAAALHPESAGLWLWHFFEFSYISQVPSLDGGTLYTFFFPTDDGAKPCTHLHTGRERSSSTRADRQDLRQPSPCQTASLRAAGSAWKFFLEGPTVLARQKTRSSGLTESSWHRPTTQVSFVRCRLSTTH